MRAPALPNTPPSLHRKGLGAAEWAFVIVGGATLCRLIVAALLPLGVDEAYSIGIARQFSLSYFDHPPLHLWLVGGWAKLLGSEEPLLLRLPFVALGALSSLLMFGLTRRLFGEAAALWSVALFNLAPIFGIAHGTLILPDGPLIGASLAMAWVLTDILFGARQGPRLGTWALAGLLAGLALLSKYHGFLMVGGVLLFLVSSKRERHWLATPGPWLAAGIAGVMLLPVIIWNAQHDWVSFGFQAGRGRIGSGLRLLGPIESLLTQSVYLLPWLGVPLAAFLLRTLLGGPGSERRWFLACLSALPIAIFTLLTLFGRGLPHWQMPGWLFAIPLLAEALTLARPLVRRIARGVAVSSAALIALVAGLGLLQARWGSFEPERLALFGGVDPTDSLAPWDELKGKLAARGLPADGKSFIAALSWVRAGELNALFGKDIPVLCLCADARHFAYLNPPSAFAGWTAILVDVPQALDNADKLAPMFDSVSAAEDVSLRKAGRVALPLSLRIGTGFRPPAAFQGR